MAQEKRVAVRLPVELYDELKDLADRKKRSINSQIIYLLEQSISANNDQPMILKVVSMIEGNNRKENHQ